MPTPWTKKPRNLCAPIGVALAFLLVVGCNRNNPAVYHQTSPKAPPMQAPRSTGEVNVQSSFWIPGEQMRFRVSVKGIKALSVILGVGNPGTVEGKRVIIVSSRMETAGLARMVAADMLRETTTWIDLDRAGPVYRKDKVQLRGKRQSVESKYERDRITQIRQRDDRATRTRVRRVPPDHPVLDMHAILGILRAWSPRVGAYGYFDVLEDRLCRHTVRLTRYELLQTTMGKHPVIRIDGEVRPLSSSFRPRSRRPGKKYTIWITNDAARMPVRVLMPQKSITVQLELVEYRKPKRSMFAAQAPVRPVLGCVHGCTKSGRDSSGLHRNRHRGQQPDVVRHGEKGAGDLGLLSQSLHVWLKTRDAIVPGPVRPTE